MAMASRVFGRSLSYAAARYAGISRPLAAAFVAKDMVPPVAARVSVRCFASKPDGGLLKLLKAEIEHEKGEEGALEDLKMKPPQPFTVENKPGTQEVILRRSYNSEDVAVACLFRLSPYDEPEEEEDDEENEQPVSQEEVHMTVTVSKGSDEPVLEISCTCTQGDIEIERVSYVESKDEMAYSGPEFTELDEDLQKQFRKYLEARGINQELCNFLINYMPEKERQEYIRWLEKIEKFVRK